MVRSRDDAFEALFTREYARVAGIANRVLGDRHEAEDVAQEVFVDFHRLHSATAQFAAPWLYRAAVHEALNRVRGRKRRGLYRAAVHEALNRVRGRKRRERRELSQATEESARTVDPQRELENSEDRRMVREALGRLAPKPAAVLVLRASGLSYAEVAQAVGVGTGQIGTLLRRAEAALRKEVTSGTSN